jgi:pyruvate ferredoxin oxidoreductase alpha subunit
VVPAYPITPQTHIVEGVGRLVRSGDLSDCRFLTVESEFAAMSAAIGASAAGSRAYTATASQGLLYMVEALYNASGLGLPIVMTVANRAIGAPINIWNDQTDSISQRDCGWVQLYAADNQDAVDLHIIAFRLAEELSVPTMVCVDGFVLTHAFEPLEIPDQAAVDAFLPRYQPRQVLDPAEPVTIGAMVGPEAYTEVRFLSQVQHDRVESLLDSFGQSYRSLAGRSVSAVSSLRTEDADTVVVALGSVTGTLQQLSNDLAAEGESLGVVSVTLFRPFPFEAIRQALSAARRVIVIERAFAPGSSGALTADVRQALQGRPVELHTVFAGLGGRAMSRDALRDVVRSADAGSLAEVSFLQLKQELVDAELERMTRRRASGPVANNLLADSPRPGSTVG